MVKSIQYLSISILSSHRDLNRALRITLQLFEEAEPLCRRALRKREEMLGPEHRDTLTSAPRRGGGWRGWWRCHPENMVKHGETW
jgi:hypothetical protein